MILIYMGISKYTCETHVSNISTFTLNTLNMIQLNIFVVDFIFKLLRLNFDLLFIFN